MTIETVKKDVVELIFELFKDRGYDAEIIEYLDLVDDLGMDSITFISIVVEIEAKFDITIPDDLLSFEYFKHVDDIVIIIDTARHNTTKERR